MAAVSSADPAPTVAACTGVAEDRLSLLEAVVERLRAAGALDAAPVEVPPAGARFYGDGDRWEGWREDDGPGLPAEPPPTRSEVLAALRRLPLSMRAVLVLRDGAGIDAVDCARIVRGTVTEQVNLLDRARAAYVAAVAEQLARRPS